MSLCFFDLLEHLSVGVTVSSTTVNFLLSSVNDICKNVKSTFKLI